MRRNNKLSLLDEKLCQYIKNNRFNKKKFNYNVTLKAQQTKLLYLQMNKNLLEQKLKNSCQKLIQNIKHKELPYRLKEKSKSKMSLRPIINLEQIRKSIGDTNTVEKDRQQHIKYDEDTFDLKPEYFIRTIKSAKAVRYINVKSNYNENKHTSNYVNQQLSKQIPHKYSNIFRTRTKFLSKSNFQKVKSIYH